mmetsp:Transcript_81293/g.227930  ORF Transcript_81293/g.227930 Transcript_81293/m.227930 type:complete len:215 (-) Transcript_81293:57-701(-)
MLRGLRPCVRLQRRHHLGQREERGLRRGIEVRWFDGTGGARDRRVQGTQRSTPRVRRSGHADGPVGFVGLLPCLTLCCFAFFTEALTIPWLGHDPKSWMIGRGACCLGMLLAIIASCIAWGTGTRLELLLYSPGLMVVFCLFNLVAFCCIGLGRVYFAKPVIEVPAPEVPPPEVHVTEKLRAVEPPAVRECAPAEVSERAEDPVARVSAPILQL